MSTTVTLSRPIDHGTQTLKELTLRDVTVKDIRRLGYPFTMLTGRGQTEVKFDMEAVAQYISLLAAIPPSVVDRLSLQDFSKLQAVVCDFFGEYAA